MTDTKSNSDAGPRDRVAPANDKSSSIEKKLKQVGSDYTHAAARDVKSCDLIQFLVDRLKYLYFVVV